MSLVAVGGLLTLGLVLASAVWASRESDLAALDRQRQLVNSRLHNQLDLVAGELVLMADGYAGAIANVGATGVLDLAAGERFTRIVTSIFKYDEAFVVRSDGTLAIPGGADAAGRYEWVRPLLLPMLDDAVAAHLPATLSTPAPDSARIVELTRLQGRPTIAGVVALPGGAGPTTGGRSLFLIAYRYLDGPALDALSHDQGLSGARYARFSDPEPNEVTFQIQATATGEPIGVIIWTPDIPGSRVVVGIMPALTMAAAIIAALVAGLVMLLRKSWADLRSSEQKAQHRSKHDILTDLPNRGLFSERLEACLGQTRPGNPTTVALIDLDRFKAVNDTFGHGAGDEVIRAVATRINALLPHGDLLARLGGDEFALLLPGPAAVGQSYVDLCNQIIGELSQPFAVLNGKAATHIGCSIGLTTVTYAAPTASEVLHSADLALYEAKTSGRGRCVEYAPTMDASARHRDRLRADLAAVLDQAEQAPSHWSPRHGIEVFYQTIHPAGRLDRISGAEALVRWRHETLGLLSPDRFIALAEESGLIRQLGRLVLRQACVTATTWPEHTTLAVNVSPTQLRTSGFAEDVLRVLAETGLPPARLELEVTETALMGGDEAIVQAALTHLRTRGVSIALDDFGTGYSSLSHLIHFGIDRLKIDRSFVQLLGTRSDGAAIVSAVMALSQSLGLATTAEGVETAGQQDFLVAAGCTDLQGYLFSRPAPAADIAAMMHEPERAALGKSAVSG